MEHPGTPVPRPLVIPPPGSRLEQLLDMRDAAEAVFKDAEANLKMVKEGIKAEAAAEARRMLPPDTDLPPVIDIAGDAHRPPLTQRWKCPRQVNGKRLRADYPDLWDKYAEYGNGYWELRAG